MANRPSSMGSSKSGDNVPKADSKQHNLKLTKKMEMSLLAHIIRLKPCGTNKHLSMLLIRDKLSEEFELNVPTSSIWKYLDTQWNIEAADKLEGTVFNTDDKNFTLPKEFDPLIAEVQGKKHGHHKNLKMSEEDLIRKFNLKQPRVEIERVKLPLTEPKSNHSMQNKNEAIHKVKGKRRGRVTSDMLVVRQPPEEPLGRRSCTIKSLTL